MTDKKTEALKLALEALVDNRHYIVANERTEYLEIYDKSIDAVEKALAEQPTQQQEPVAIIASLMPAERHTLLEEGHSLHDSLYTSPPNVPTARASKPLTDDDTRRLQAVVDNSWDLRCFSVPTGADDADIGWRVIEHHEAKPNERVIAEVFYDDPRRAIDLAIEAAHGIKEKNT